MSQLSVQLKNLHFDYNEKTQVFNGHNLVLQVESKQSKKLYGIIGPSGTGKTTLISILGGQLKPTKGEVLICGVNIYEVNDLQRRELITMQMQTATSLRGELKYNLLFGLPIEEEANSQEYDDDYLISILQQVGLWSLFADKDGLKTLIGEGGLNLSGGQRQRLNFAGLYLRAKHFKSKLILIDEPTSSLDEISEQAITRMINELSEFALTLVVAHRLKTLDEAVAIMDSSLISSSDEINFFARNELLNESQYYCDLMAGKAQLEE
ncbi:MAG: ATP-binding cassette domain-containing protein [Patescibacteria group bacterium]